MSAIGPVDHIPRPALPWRTAPQLTECGQPLERVDPEKVITLAALVQRIRDVGQARAAYTTCMTCWDTARRWDSEHPDMIRIVHRETGATEYAERSVSTAHLSASRREHAEREQQRRQRLVSELEAIVALVEAHRDEFDGYLAGVGETVSLAQRRAAASRPAPRGRTL